ncbi:MAG: MraY family glycosyltransferase, partial [Gemmataceae bacterium]
MGWLIAFIAAFGVSLLTNRLLRAYAPRLGLVDAPDGKRKLQAAPVPVGGGLGVLLGAITGCVLGYFIIPEARALFDENINSPIAVLVSAIIIAGIGLADDVIDLRARLKLLGQFVAISILIGPGEILLREASLFGTTYNLGWFAYPITYFWFFAAINALNLLDGMDGLLGTVGMIVFGAFAAMSEVTGQAAAGLMAVSMAAGLAGFLRYNLPPATIYMGDTGSMLVGLMVGVVAITASLKSHAVALIAPTALLVLPFL